MKLIIEQSGPYFYGFLGEVEVTHRLNSKEARQLNEDGEEYHAGDESTVFLSRKSLTKEARRLCRRLDSAMEE